MVATKKLAKLLKQMISKWLIFLFFAHLSKEAAAIYLKSSPNHTEWEHITTHLDTVFGISTNLETVHGGRLTRM